MYLSEEEWKKRLTPEEYHILRKKGTEPAFSGEYYDHHEKGIYCCAGCGQPLFSSETKYDSGSGWPSFFQPIEKDAIATESDRKLIYERIEIHCSRCGGHLGHVFDDGPAPTYQRYCTNSKALKFQRSKSVTSPDES